MKWCVEAPCPELAEPGGSRCAVHAKWEARMLAEEARERVERREAESVALVAAVAAGRAARLACAPTCRACARGLPKGREAGPFEIDGKLFCHAPARRTAPELLIGRVF